MDNKILVCNFNLFDLHQTIMLVDDYDHKTVSVTTLTDLGKSLSELCNANGIEYIHLYGDNSYANKIIKDFDKASNLKFSKNKVKIEVN